MNQFEASVARAINQHGLLSTYTSVIQGIYDPDTASVVNTKTDYSVKIYMRHLRATQYNYPNLIGKDSGMFYVPGSLLATPKPQDLITFNGKVYKVDNVQSFMVHGKLIMYRIAAAV